MYRSSFRRMIVVLALGAVLLSPWAAAAEPHVTIEPGQLSRGASLPLAWMARLWQLLDHVLTKNGCLVDPNGGCTPGQGSEPTVQEDTGCSLDPNGGCASSTPTADTGCGIDPNGGCGK